MSQRAGSRARGYLSRGALLSLLLHVHLLTPIGLAVWIFAGRQEAAREAQRAQEVDVEFADVTAAELPKDLPPLDPLARSARAAQAAGAARGGAQAREEGRRQQEAEDKTPERSLAKPEPEVARRRCRPCRSPSAGRTRRWSTRQRQGGRAAAGRAVSRPEEQPRDVETRATDKPPEGAEGREGRRRQVGSYDPSRRRQAEDRRAGGQEVGAGAEGADVTPHDNRRSRSRTRTTAQVAAALRDPAKKSARADA